MGSNPISDIKNGNVMTWGKVMVFRTFDFGTPLGVVCGIIYGTGWLIYHLQKDDKCGKFLIGLLKLMVKIIPISVGYFLATKFYSYTQGGVVGIIIAITDALFIMSPYTYFKYFQKYTYKFDNEAVEFANDVKNLILFALLNLIVGTVVMLIASLIFDEPVPYL